MKPKSSRRAVLAAAGAAAVIAAAGPTAAQTAHIQGAISFAGGVAVPEGYLAVYLEDPAIQDSAARRIARTRIDSDGGAKTIDFTLTLPTEMTVSASLRIVARLERADGWLLARGSTPFRNGTPVLVTLNTAVY